MDIALFSPSSLFPDDDDSSSSTLSLSLTQFSVTALLVFQIYIQI